MASAAGVALCASRGNAQAADVMPIVVPVVTPAVVPVPGPVRVVQIEANLETDFGQFFLETIGAVDVRAVSGWGYQVALTSGTLLGNGGFAALNGRVYRAMGDATVGAFVTTGLEYGPGINFQGVGFGIDADYRTDTTYLFYTLGAFFDGGFDGLQSIFVADVERGNFRIKAASLLQTGPVLGNGGIQVGYAIGPVTPYAFVAGGFGGGFGGLAGVGLEFEQEVGERLTLTAEALAAVGFGMAPGGLSWVVEAGFEYALGAGGDGPLTIHGNVGTGTGGGFAVEIGIGLKFGAGRVTGISGLLFDEELLPQWFL